MQQESGLKFRETEGYTTPFHVNQKANTLLCCYHSKALPTQGQQHFRFFFLVKDLDTNVKIQVLDKKKKIYQTSLVSSQSIVKIKKSRDLRA